MKKISNNLFLKAHSFVYSIFAIALFFLPHMLWRNYGVELNDRYSVFLSQHNSIFLGGIAILGFLFRDVQYKSATAVKLFQGLMWTNILGVLVTLYAAIIGVFVGFGWSDPMFFALLAVLSFFKVQENK